MMGNLSSTHKTQLFPRASICACWPCVVNGSFDGVHILRLLNVLTLVLHPSIETPKLPKNNIFEHHGRNVETC